MTTQARRPPRTEEPGRLQSLGWQSIRAHTRQGKGTVAGLVGREPDGGAQTSSKDTWVGGGVKAEDRKGGGRMDEGGVSPSQVKQGSQREAGVEGPVERGLTQPEGTQLPWREGGGTWTGAHRLVGAGAADEGSALSLQRQGGGGDEGGEDGGGGWGSAVQGNRSTACPGPRNSRAGDHESQVAVPRDTQQHDAFLGLFTTAPQGRCYVPKCEEGERAGTGARPLHPLLFHSLWCLRWSQQSLTLSRHPRKRGRWEKGSYLKPRWRAPQPTRNQR